MTAAVALPGDELDGDIEARLVSTCTLDVREVERVARIITPRDFLNPRARIVFEALLARGIELADPETGLVDLALLAKVLEERRELAAVGGLVGLLEFQQAEAMSSLARVYAHEVRRESIRREMRRHLASLAQQPDDAEVFAELVGCFDRLREIELGSRLLDAQGVGLTGDQLEALAKEAEPASPLPGFLDPEPSLHVLHGVAKTGKTTLAWLLGLAWATGRAPWEGAPALPGTRVLILSGEQGARKCLRVLRRIARTANLGTFAEWRERVTIVGRRSEMTAIDRRLLRFDAEGLAALRHVLDAAEREGDPFGLVIADSLSRLKPPAAATNDNDDMIGVLDPLAALAIEAGVYVLLIHHDGHSADRQGQAVDGVRGASAIRDVPQALLAVSRVASEPRKRLVRVAGNELPDLAQVFEVAEEWEPEGFINRFRPDSERALDLDFLFAEGPLSLTEFGRRALGWAPNWPPSGGAKRKAQRILEDFENRGVLRREGAGWRLLDD